jgi:putative hydrolase of the HAD superfamily
MKGPKPVVALFLDIGGVLLTNGWDRRARSRAAEHFHLDPKELHDRHHLTFDTYEEGKLTLDEYLERVVFHQPRDFPPEEFREFMFAQSDAYPEMLNLFRRVKKRNGLKVAAVSNEGRELTEYRIRKFDLDSLIDVFISSCFVHIRKPDLSIWSTAVDLMQVRPDQVVYVDDRLMFVQVAESLCIRGVHHQSIASTRDALAGFGLETGS